MLYVRLAFSFVPVVFLTGFDLTDRAVGLLGAMPGVCDWLLISGAASRGNADLAFRGETRGSRSSDGGASGGIEALFTGAAIHEGNSFAPVLLRLRLD